MSKVTVLVEKTVQDVAYASNEHVRQHPGLQGTFQTYHPGEIKAPIDNTLTWTRILRDAWIKQWDYGNNWKAPISKPSRNHCQPTDVVQWPRLTQLNPVRAIAIIGLKWWRYLIVQKHFPARKAPLRTLGSAAAPERGVGRGDKWGAGVWIDARHQMCPPTQNDDECPVPCASSGRFHAMSFWSIDPDRATVILGGGREARLHRHPPDVAGSGGQTMPPHGRVLRDRNRWKPRNREVIDISSRRHEERDPSQSMGLTVIISCWDLRCTAGVLLKSRLQQTNKRTTSTERHIRFLGVRNKQNTNAPPRPRPFVEARKRLRVSVRKSPPSIPSIEFDIANRLAEFAGFH
ncbi:hypothetical protein DFH07DRAFT_775288 [Mycena maculata]|uniref:Uncharacterized protein n=1 Tax=Mycena maculata TaxID=230809 RepID=A0AAD7IT33_9AGAR|nr:hypothetical protein DFH07DRAFT_775288 [Mycena maculata]